MAGGLAKYCDVQDQVHSMFFTRLTPPSVTGKNRQSDLSEGYSNARLPSHKNYTGNVVILLLFVNILPILFFFTVVPYILILSKFYHQLMHNRTALKGVLKFTLKQLQHVSV